MDIITYILLKEKIKAAATGIKDIKKDGNDIVFIMGDGSEFRIEDERKDILDVDIDNGYIVITYEDGTKTTSDKPIPKPDVMTAATETADGTSGLVPAPTKGGIGYLNSRGEWDTDIMKAVESLEDAVPTSSIPRGSTLTSDGWAVATEQEIADEFAKWED